MKVLVIHGPNLNLLNKRDGRIYGGNSLDDINSLIRTRAEELDMDIEIFQSNHEGEIVEKLHASMDLSLDGIVINPAAFTHYSIAIRDAIEMLKLPVIEVHLSNIYKREEFRQKSLIAPVCRGQISGLGSAGYLLAIEAIKLLNM